MGLNLAVVLADSARALPDEAALVHEGATTTFAELDDASARFAGWLLGEGLAPASRIALMLPNVTEFAVAYYGVLRAGMVVVPMNVQLRRREIAYYLEDSGATALLAGPEVLEEAAAAAAEAGIEHVVSAADSVAEGMPSLRAIAANHPRYRDVAQCAPADPAVFLYTSGTTGKPKAAVLSHSNLLWNAEVTSETFGVSAGDRLLGTLPLFHSFGQSCVLNGAMRRRATVVLLPRFAPNDALALIERERITHFYGVPTMFVAMLQAIEERDADVSSLRLCLSGGASIARETLEGFQRRFDVRVLEGYGLSETAPAVCFSRVDTPAKPGTIGRPLWGVEMRIADESGAVLPAGEVGEIHVRSHGMMVGYHNRPEATAAAIDADGWFHTGDLAYVDPDGDYFIVDRKKDLIIRGGYNVYPREVEEVLYEHPDVFEAAVVGLADPRLGEEVGAALVARPGRAIEPAELRDFLTVRVASYKRPRRFAFLPELPKGPTGKILKRELDADSFAAEERAGSRP
jgi:long-chain acyl-CoA synthetase